MTVNFNVLSFKLRWVFVGWWFLLLTSSLLLGCQPQEKTQAQADTIKDEQQAQPISIAAAANLADVLPQIISGYCIDRGLNVCPIETVFASSGKLYAQIIAGAPYDIFLAANQSYPEKLVVEMVGEQAQHQPFTYTRGQLALYSTTQVVEPDGNNLTLLKNPDFKVAIANPELAPYGVAAQAYLTELNLYDVLNKQKRLIMAENIGQAFQFTNTGHADVGFVALSQIKGLENQVSESKVGHYQVIPSNTYPAILQDGLVITNNSMAEDFVRYLQSDKGQAYFAQAGYLSVLE
ncbi:molybdate ABC transporter substrate-binding protein [Psychrobacter sp. I-STPA6b]|uniref:molybdate ABC transporter substrate-binding protein n=1 Tax=Psychrobacter sp. I-STPA6b TaxID=2585718 RepID=UPI001D0C67D9|nr:molybdate ABC transporter substrate-binding protein [Psychrobacter sp. I-STPA6b]